MHGGKGAPVSSALVTYAGMLSELSLANFPTSVEDAQIQMVSMNELRSDPYLLRVFGVCRYAISVQRLINTFLRKLAEMSLIPPMSGNGVECGKIAHPNYYDASLLEGDEEDMSDIFSSIVYRRYRDMVHGLGRVGIQLKYFEPSELASHPEDFFSLVDENYECQNFSIVEDVSDCDFEDMEELDERYVCYRIIMPALRPRIIKAIARFMSFDLDLGFNVSVYSKRGEILLIAPTIYQTGYGDPMDPAYSGLAYEEDGQAITAASYVYMYAVAKKEVRRRNRARWLKKKKGEREGRRNRVVRRKYDD